MKVLVFSDTHLTDALEEKKYALLESLIKEVDLVIINGDFWDGYLTTFDKFIKSPWNRLFPLLKVKNTIYIYGNHDRAEFSDDRVKQFSVNQATSYKLEVKDTTFVIEHGNRLLPAPDEKFNLPKIFSQILTRIYTPLEGVITRLTKTTARFWRIFQNGELKKQIQNKPEIYIFGHTHIPSYEMENHFINLGCFQHGLAQYLIIQDGKAFPHSKLYE